ncbi:MAG TPA: YihY/virulence factor BrkB family protein [Burkholderiales bacterium]|nr:YihY/virulence factor BrkB family protein [Burkholderiales bacterium]
MISLFKQALKAWSDDYVPSMGAALAYYTLFSIAPLLLIVIGVAGLVFGEAAARGEIFEQMRGLMGDAGADAIEKLLQDANRPAGSAIATITGVATLLLGAMTVFGELQNDLDRIWRAPPDPETKGWWKLVRARMLSFGMVLGMAFLLMVSLAVSAVVSALGTWWGSHFLDWGINFLLMTLMFAMIYKIIPRARIEWRDVWIGAAVTSALFAVGKVLIGLYLGRSSVASAFGAAGSLVAMMVWVYYSAQVFLLGAEFTRVYAHARGSRAGGAHSPTGSGSADRTIDGAHAA